ncbi:MAG: glutathione S-transferase family protein [Alphaproteobacteria bacterium]
MFTLYHFSLCPFSRQTRLLLNEMGIEFNCFEEKYWEYNLSFAKLNPAMEVPVLIDSANMPVASINAILEYLLEYTENSKLFSNDMYEKAEIRRLVSWFNEKFHTEVTKLILNERIIRFYTSGGEPNSEFLRIAKFNLNYHLDYLSHLLNNRRWIAGEQLTIVDFIAASHLSVLDYLGNIQWNYSEIVKEWYSVIKSRPSFRDILTDRISGFMPTKHYYNLDF